MKKFKEEYLKSDIVSSRKFKDKKDVLNSLLSDKLAYSLDEIKAIIKAYEERMI